MCAEQTKHEEKKQHLDFIQNIITRMNTTSFIIKGMTITIISALVAIFTVSENAFFLFLSTLPTLLFWFMDSFYLQQERKYRGIYNDVAGLTNNVEVKPYEMPLQKYTYKIDVQFCFLKILFSRTILPFYSFITLCLALSGLYIKRLFIYWKVLNAKKTSFLQFSF